MVLPAAPVAPRRPAHRYLRAPVPLYFPVEERVPETALHRMLVDRLFESVRRELGKTALISCDQFMYWDPTDPRLCLAPDLAVRLGGPPLLLDTWKIWEHGAPHLAVEIVSDSDASERNVEQKLARYRQTGVPELVCFDRNERTQPLRIWDLVAGDLVERDSADAEFKRCDALGLYWHLPFDADERCPTLRLARDRDGGGLLLTDAEGEAVERAAKEAALAAKEAALARVAELEAELARNR
jgi:Uma2 family endonuclease